MDDLDLHKRVIFIQKISPQTTRQSLEDYFSNYPIQRCTVPIDETGKNGMSSRKTSWLFCAGQNRMHGIITFHNEESVDAVMSQRFHQIDGKEVFIHRSVPAERLPKDSYAMQQLIVFSLKDQLLIESDIRRYFSSYGEICNISNMNNDDNIWIIDFD